MIEEKILKKRINSLPPKILQKIIEKIFKKYPDMPKTNYDNIWELYVAARDHTYPTPEKDWNTLSTRDIESKFNGLISRGWVHKKIKQGILRTAPNKQVYEKDLEIMMPFFTISEELKKQGVMKVRRDMITGEKVLVVIKPRDDRNRKSQIDQQLKALYEFTQTPFFKEFQRQVDKQTIM